MYYANIRLITLMFILASLLMSQDQGERTTTFRMFAEIGGGYAYKLTDPKVVYGSYVRDGVAGTVRLKWGSSNLLGVGVESGWLPISSTKAKSVASEFGTIDVTASLHAVPLMAVFSMQRLGIQLHTGIGYYNVRSSINVMGTAMESSEWNLGFVAAMGFARPISSAYRVGAEVKWYSIVEQQISVVSIQIRVLYQIFGD